MPDRRRRSVLRTAALGLGVLGAGCGGSSVDERVDTTPPGDPSLDPQGAWPSYRFDAGNTGAVPGGAGLHNGEAYWRLDAGGPATVADGTLYNVRARGDGPKTLSYRDPATAAVTTRRPLVEYGVNAPPTVADGGVFVTTFVEAFCFDSERGERRWRGPEMGGIGGPPTVADGRVFVATGGFEGVRPHLRALDVDGGATAWRSDTDDGTHGTPAVGDGLAFVGGDDGLYAVEMDSGEVAYVVTDARNVRGSPAVDDGTVYVVSEGASTAELVAVATDDGTVRWRTPVVDASADVDRTPVVAPDAVYTHTEEGVTALAPADGSVRATNPEPAWPVALVGDVLYAAAEGTVFAFDAGTDLESLWSLRTEDVQVRDTVGRIVNHVTPVDGAVYVSARDAFHGVGTPRQ